MSVLIITFLYSAVGVATLIGYIPQIIQLVRVKTKRHMVSIPSWSLWTITSLISLLYAIVVIQDLIFSAVSLVNFAGCFTITGLEIYNRTRRFNVA